MIRRGEIYLVNFGKKYNSEFGKIRPALVIQNDIANRNIDKVEFKGVTVLPITSNLCGGDLRVFLEKRENLEKDSEVCVNEVCTLDLGRIATERVLTALSEKEMAEVEAKFAGHCGLG